MPGPREACLAPQREADEGEALALRAQVFALREVGDSGSGAEFPALPSVRCVTVLRRRQTSWR